MKYRFHLIHSRETRAAGMAPKAVCPQCHKKRFSLYVDDNLKPAGPEYGRCERVNECGYNMYPPSAENDYKQPYMNSQPTFAARIAGYNKRSTGSGPATTKWANPLTPPTPRACPLAVSILELNRWTNEQVANVWKRYGVGRSTTECTLFPYWSGYGLDVECVAVKSVSYVGLKRNKDAPITYTGAAEGWPRMFRPRELKQDAPLIVFESEKTALVFTLAQLETPDAGLFSQLNAVSIGGATGNMDGLKAHGGLILLAFDDDSAGERGTARIVAACKNVRVLSTRQLADGLKLLAPAGTGIDLADLILNGYEREAKPETPEVTSKPESDHYVSPVTTHNPQLYRLIDSPPACTLRAEIIADYLADSCNTDEPF